MKLSVLGYITISIFALGLAYGCYVIQRNLNYTLSYESMVEQTVCDMVKPEYIKTPEKCND